MTRRRARDDEAAVSTVLGAILMFGLFVLALVMIRTEFVPEWQRERERDLMDDVHRQMADLKSVLDGQVGNQSQAPVTVPMPLRAAAGFAFFQESSLPGTLSFRPAASGQGLRMSASQVTFQEQGGVTLYGLGEEWTPMAGGSVAAVTDVVHLRMRVDMDPGDYDEGDTATITVTDANGAFAGRVVAEFLSFPSEDALEIRTYGPTNALISSDVEAFFQQSEIAYMYFDLLEPSLFFREVLAATAAPFTLGLSTSGLQAEYTIVYDTGSGGGSTRVGATGVTVPNYAATTAVGAVTVEKDNNRYPGQAYTLEYGAVILEQADGAVMVVPPQFAVGLSATQASVSWSLPALLGSPNAVAGSGSASVTSTPGSHSRIVAFAPHMVFNITTPHPLVWAGYWNATFAAAGLSTSAGHYTVATTATTATLAVYGPTAAPASTANDLSVLFQTANLSIDIKATG